MMLLNALNYYCLTKLELMPLLSPSASGALNYSNGNHKMMLMTFLKFETLS